MSWLNSDGLMVRFNSEIGVRGAKAGVTCGAGKRRELVLEVDLVALGANGTSYTADLNNDGTNDGFTTLNTPLPSGVKIDDVDIIVETALAGGTNYQVGTYVENGTVVDADGLITTAGAAGAQVGTVTTADWFVGVLVSGTYTAGKIKIIISYLTV